MKKLILLLTIILVFIIQFNLTYAAGITVTVDGKLVSFPDAKPYIDSNNRTLIPIRFVSEALGAAVDWNPKTQEVNLKLGAKVAKLIINNNTYYVNGLAQKMDTKAIIKQSRTFVPIRFVAEALGATVDWNTKTSTVIITTQKDINGFKIPTGTNIRYTSGAGVDILMRIDLTKPLEKQYEDLKFIITSKYIEDIYNQLLEYIKKKKVPDDDLEYKEFVLADGKTLDVASSKSVNTILIKIYASTN